MRIIRVQLENIRSYTSCTVEFPEGAVLLSGDIGAGKTTVLLAMEFALFGIIKGELNAENLLRHGTNQGSVELTFALEGKEHTIKRRLKRGKNGIAQEAGYLLSDGSKYEGTAIELKARILDLLGYPQELLTKSKSLIYRYTVFTPQEQMKRILTDQAEYRLDTLRKVFGMDRYKRVAEHTEITIRMLRERETALAATIAPLAEKRTQLETQQNTIHSIRTTLSALEPKLQQATVARNVAEQTVEQKEMALRESLALQQELTALELAIKEKATTLARDAKELAQIAKAMLTADAELAKLPVVEIREPLAAVQQRVGILERQLQEQLTAQASAVAKQQALEHERQDLAQRMAACTEALAGKATIEQSRNTLHSTAAQRSAQEAVLQQLERERTATLQEQQTHRVQTDTARQLQQRIGALQNCPTCLQSVTSEHKHRIQDTQQQVATAHQQQLATASEKLRQIEQQQTALRAQLAESQRATEQLARVEAELRTIAQHERERSSAAERQDAVQHELAALAKIEPETLERLQQQLRQERELLEHVRVQTAGAAQRTLLTEQRSAHTQRHAALERQQHELAATTEIANTRLCEVRTQHAKFSERTRELTEAKSTLAAALAQQQELSVQQATLAAQQDAAQKLIQQLEQECATGARMAEEYERTKQLKHWLNESFLNVLGVMEKQVMQRVHQEFSLLFQQWFAALIEDAVISARLDDTFNPIIEQNGFETDIESLSGGERTALALAYRLSLNKVINTLISTIRTRDLIVLDEPTEGFSTEQLDRVRDVLQQMGMRQVIVVSHEGKVEGFVDHVIRIGKEGHESKVL